MRLPAFLAAFLLPAAISLAADPIVRIPVALYDDAGSAGKGIPRVEELLKDHARFAVTKLKAADIQSGALSRYKVVIFTGGSGGKQASTLTPSGVEAVRKFVDHGGGYIGICAGAYLACQGFSWSAGILNAQTVSPKWRRGTGDVIIEPTKSGHEILRLPKPQYPVRYANGPIIKPANNPALSPYETLASFRTELAENGTPVGVMVNSPAIVSGTFGKGRVICSSGHPEQTVGLENFIESALLWTTGVQN